MTIDDAEIERAVEWARGRVSWCDERHEPPCVIDGCNAARVLLALHAERETNLAEVKRRDLLLQSLTPMGSEYVNDPERCAAYAKQVRQDQHELIKRKTGEAKDAFSRGWKARSEEMAEWIEDEIRRPACMMTAEGVASHARALAETPTERKDG